MFSFAKNPNQSISFLKVAYLSYERFIYSCLRSIPCESTLEYFISVRVETSFLWRHYFLFLFHIMKLVIFIGHRSSLMLFEGSVLLMLRLRPRLKGINSPLRYTFSDVWWRNLIHIHQRIILYAKVKSWFHIIIILRTYGGSWWVRFFIIGSALLIISKACHQIIMKLCLKEFIIHFKND